MQTKFNTKCVSGNGDDHGSQVEMGHSRKMGIEEGLCDLLDAAEAEIHRCALSFKCLIADLFLELAYKI